jgi:quercetin dioxygenase-like cupin family protein
LALPHRRADALLGSGTGRIKKEGEEAFHVQPGDLVYVAPGEKHWHGATQDQFLVHFAFTASGKTQWLEEVTEDEYLSEP